MSYLSALIECFIFCVRLDSRCFGFWQKKYSSFEIGAQFFISFLSVCRLYSSLSLFIVCAQLCANTFVIHCVLSLSCILSVKFELLFFRLFCRFPHRRLEKTKDVIAFEKYTIFFFCVIFCWSLILIFILFFVFCYFM